MALLSNFHKKNTGGQTRRQLLLLIVLPSGRITKKNGSLSSNLPINVFLIFPSRTPWSEKKNTTVLLRWPPSKRMQEKNRKDYDKFVLALTLFELVIFLWFRLIVKQKLAKKQSVRFLGSGPEVVDDLCFHTNGEFSSSPSSSVYPLKSQSRGPSSSLAAQIPVSRSKSQPQDLNPSLEAQILA